MNFDKFWKNLTCGGATRYFIWVWRPPHVPYGSRRHWLEYYFKVSVLADGKTKLLRKTLNLPMLW